MKPVKFQIWLIPKGPYIIVTSNEHIRLHNIYVIMILRPVFELYANYEVQTMFYFCQTKFLLILCLNVN